MALSDILEQSYYNRRKFLKKFGIGAIALTLNLDSFSLATDSFKDNQNKEHKYNVFKFYLDPKLVPNMEFVKKVLPKYVNDMNHILQKNTNLELLFKSETDIILTPTQPHSNNAGGQLLLKDFEIWVHTTLSDKNYSYGGYQGIDKSGASVLAGLKWREIYDPDNLKDNPNELRDYWIQIDHMLHELGHVFGAAISEYYNLSLVDDTTGVEPILNIRLSNPNDSYWKNKADYKKDPMLGNALFLVSTPIKDRPKSRAELLETVKYSNLTAAFINGQYRGKFKSTIPDLKNIKLKVIDRNSSKPVQNATVKIFGIKSFPPYENKLLVNKTTNNSGELIFDWGTSNPFNNYEHLRLIKISKEDYKPQAEYISTFDLQEAKLLHNKSIFSVDIHL